MSAGEAVLRMFLAVTSAAGTALVLWLLFDYLHDCWKERRFRERMKRQ